eukprot:GAHX01000748.1.p1 GENE.GAHX01000748.1~~GAHX01000748.1.p1  ORF type:complete len:179 (-),score=19.09 GAHX01000748.1:32-568(-)
MEAKYPQKRGRKRKRPVLAKDSDDPSVKRLVKEWIDISLNPPRFAVSYPKDTNIKEWSASVGGPEGSPYAGGIFHFSILFPSDYPFYPPKITFLTRIYHCNISSSGTVNLTTLDSEWTPTNTIRGLLESVVQLLKDPNPHDPLWPDVAQKYLHHRQLHDHLAREWTRKYATGMLGIGT